MEVQYDSNLKELMKMIYDDKLQNIEQIIHKIQASSRKVSEDLHPKDGKVPF